MKMASQRFCLRWNNHQSNLLSVFDQLLHAETFTDVTLAVDGQYLKAHKMVLSACSPYFNALFLNHPEKHPIVILKDVPYADMKSLLDFMYRGEVSVDQERLTAFLRVAESLRIKGLTEVNDDKPSNSEPTPQPPQLQRIQPYTVQQQQRHKSHQSSSMNSSNSNNAQNSASQQQQHQQQQQQLQQQQQQSLLSSALAQMPKRKRGRPRKLSGSDDGDYDEFDGEMGDGKMCNDSYSGNDDGSDDNQRDSGNNDDMNESRDSVSPSKKSKQQLKDIRNQQQQDDNSTSVHLITSTPELSQRLFGVNKNNFNNTTAIPITTTTASTNNSNSTLISLQAQTQNTTATKIASIEFNEALTAHLPTVLGLKIKSNLQNATQTAGQQQQQQQQQLQQQQHAQQQQQQQQISTVPISTNPNSLLKQQLRAGLKELIDVTITNATTTNTLSQQTAPSSTNANHLETQEACSALQSLANVAERQAQNNIQPPSANNLHHQFLLHMAANPILKSSGEFFHQQNALLMREEEHNLDLLMDQSDKSDPEMLTLADENAGLDYSTGNETGGGNQTGCNEQLESSANSGNNNNTGGSNNTTPRAKNSSNKPVQRRRIRRKAQSSLDDQAEQLTEMSVRGLDLFRYASINEGVYQCTECAKENMQKTFKNKYSFQRHAFLYHEGKHRKVFPCPLCGKEFSRPDKMKNHMKMTHESFVAKEIQNFNPLNYLITAAGEIQASFNAPNNNTQTQSNVVNTPQPLLNQLQANNPALSIMINNNDNNEEGLNLTQQQQKQQQQQENLNDFNLHKPLKFPTDIEIKNEIVISPSPSPPPTTSSANTANFSSTTISTPISLAETLSLLKTSVQTTTTTAQLNAQRLEEVK
ncbi:protein tramtrack, alpha isoform isoform X1 [Calliphora vicina]|uniref:protein tramtrack, alpha isoform isoform X1 n=1 Tax=Calliphora vicina TaxID=7373 RepID=UPI00325B0396